MDHPIDIALLSPELVKICGPDAPTKMKMMVADGLRPLPPKSLVTVLYVLAYDENKTVQQKARHSLTSLPPNLLSGAIDQIAQPQVLDGLTQLLISNDAVVNRIVLSPDTSPETVIFIAGRSTFDQTLEIIANNEERLLANPRIIEALYHNKHTRMSTVDRAVELAVRNGIVLDGVASFAEVKAAIEGELILEPTAEPSPEDVAFQGSLDAEKWKHLTDEDVDAAHDDSDKAAQEEAKKKVATSEKSLTELNVSAKIRVATIGSSLQRSVLIRDSNKLVIMAVIKSPALNDAEAMRFSQFRTLPEEALRYIASNREWTKHYTVKLNLVQNPRCPMELSLRFLNHIRVNDLRILSRSKNIPQAVARAAKNLLVKRT